MQAFVSTFILVVVFSIVIPIHGILVPIHITMLSFFDPEEDKDVSLDFLFLEVLVLEKSFRDLSGTSNNEVGLRLSK